MEMKPDFNRFLAAVRHREAAFVWNQATPIQPGRSSTIIWRCEMGSSSTELIPQGFENEDEFYGRSSERN